MKNRRTALIVLVASLMVVAFVVDRRHRDAELARLRESLSQIEQRPAPAERAPSRTAPAPKDVPPAPASAARREPPEDEPLHDEKPFASRFEEAFTREGVASEDEGDRRRTDSVLQAALGASDELQSLGCRSTTCRAELVFDDVASLNKAALRINRPLAVASYDQRADGRLHAVVFLGHEGDLDLQVPEDDAVE